MPDYGTRLAANIAPIPLAPSSPAAGTTVSAGIAQIITFSPPSGTTSRIKIANNTGQTVTYSLTGTATAGSTPLPTGAILQEDVTLAAAGMANQFSVYCASTMTVNGPTTTLYVEGGY